MDSIIFSYLLYGFCVARFGDLSRPKSDFNCLKFINFDEEFVILQQQIYILLITLLTFRISALVSKVPFEFVPNCSPIFFANIEVPHVIPW